MQDPMWINPAPALGSDASAAAAAAGKPRLGYDRQKVYKARSPQDLVGDVAKLADQQYDLSGRLRRERDAADKKLLAAEATLRFANFKIWILAGLALVQFTLIGWGVTRLLELFDLVQK
jgi:hypothetical protein